MRRWGTGAVASWDKTDAYSKPYEKTSFSEPSAGGGARGAGAAPGRDAARAATSPSGAASHRGAWSGREAGPHRPAWGARRGGAPPTPRDARYGAGRGAGCPPSPATSTGPARANAAPPCAHRVGHAPSQRPRRSRPDPGRGLWRRGSGPRPAPPVARRWGAWPKARAARQPPGSGRWGRRPPTRNGSPTETSDAPLGRPCLPSRSTALRPHGTVFHPSGAPATPARQTRTGACLFATQRSRSLGRGAPPEAATPGLTVWSQDRREIGPARLPSPPPPLRSCAPEAAGPVEP